MPSAIGIDFGGTNTKVAIVTESGSIKSKTSFETGSPFSRDKWIQSLNKKIADLQKKNPSDVPLGIGIGIAALVDPEKKTVLHAPNITGIDGWEMGKDLEKHFQMPVKIDNDVNAVALGEHIFKKTGGARNIVVLTLGTGVGGGLILGGRLYRGSRFIAGELGHITINEKGPRCSCGNTGCAEAYLGNQRIVSNFKELLKKGRRSLLEKSVQKGENLTPQLIYEAAKNGDEASLQIWEGVAEHLATLLSSVINLLNPDRIIIGGGVANAFDLIEKPLWEHLKKRALKDALNGLVIERSHLGSDAGVIGAASLVLEKEI
ncbi:MAG: ROK family protein [Candidatus Aureabacteria bacterium]|nr:ROK family protein [Candidatus Auribacterota bacterium]